MTGYDGKELPHRYGLPPDDDRTRLHDGVVKALYALPMHFTSPINIEGLEANDLFSINTLLGGTIEAQTVMLLNSMRDVWDPQNHWAGYEFRRYPESFPDVRLVNANANEEPLIGIELKGWYILSKEGEPSLRYKASADAMTEWDLLCCVPWGLSNVLSGKPVAYTPYVEQAKYAADMRTYYWNHREGNPKGRDCTITHPDTHPYPQPGSSYTDVPAQDGGGNFGRITRAKGLMKEWVEESMTTPLAGIEARYWVRFFGLFKEGASKDDILRGLDKLEAEILHAGNSSTEETAQATDILSHLNAIIRYAYQY